MAQKLKSMKQIFNCKRFFSYAKFNILSNRKYILLLNSGFAIGLLFFITFVLRVNNNWTSENWTMLFYTLYAILGVLLIGNSFPFFRKKETSLNLLMLPCSSFEKFLYELLTKFVAFTLVYSIVFSIVSGFSEVFVSYLLPDKEIISFSFDYITLSKNEGVMSILIWSFLFGFSTVFAGAAAIRKFPLLKTIIFLATVILSISGYFYFIIEKLDLKKGVNYVGHKVDLNEQQALSIFITFLVISTLTALTYAFFKFKEKEV